MGIELTPFEKEPRGEGIVYLLRASISCGGEYIGPFHPRRLKLPACGPFIDSAGVGIHGIIGANNSDGIIDCLKLAFTLKEIEPWKITWQIFSAISDELERDSDSERMGYRNSRRVKRGWVCFRVRTCKFA